MGCYEEDQTLRDTPWPDMSTLAVNKFMKEVTNGKYS